MCHKIRAAMMQPQEKLGGIVEVDETYVGGKDYWKHWDKKSGGRGGTGSTRSLQSFWCEQHQAPPTKKSRRQRSSWVIHDRSDLSCLPVHFRFAPKADLRASFEIGCQACNSSSSALASFKSKISKASVDKP
jgi:hypothetical protein